MVRRAQTSLPAGLATLGAVAPSTPPGMNSALNQLVEPARLRNGEQVPLGILSERCQQRDARLLPSNINSRALRLALDRLAGELPAG